MNDQQKRVPLQLLPQHLDYITNLLGTANLRYVDTAPILNDIGQQVQAMQQQPQLTDQAKPNGAQQETVQ